MTSRRASCPLQSLRRDWHTSTGLPEGSQPAADRRASARFNLAIDSKLRGCEAWVNGNQSLALTSRWRSRLPHHLRNHGSSLHLSWAVPTSPSALWRLCSRPAVRSAALVCCAVTLLLGRGRWGRVPSRTLRLEEQVSATRSNYGMQKNQSVAPRSNAITPNKAVQIAPSIPTSTKTGSHPNIAARVPKANIATPIFAAISIDGPFASQPGERAATPT